MVGWQIDEDSTFGPSVMGCGGFELIDEVLETLEVGLHSNPEGFTPIPGFLGLYIAKTKFTVISGKVVPALTLWFRVDRPERLVTKLYVQATEPDDMLCWEDGDDVPF